MVYKSHTRVRVDLGRSVEASYNSKKCSDSQYCLPIRVPVKEE